MSRYGIVTPARNEQKYLPQVVASIVDGTTLPEIWVIVNDSSTDSTGDIAHSAAALHEFITVVDVTDKAERDLRFRYSEICRRGFRELDILAQRASIQLDYVALMDADISVERAYFERVIRYMDNHPDVGIASGDVTGDPNIFKNGSARIVSKLRDTPSGAARVWRRRCFEETGGFPNSQSPDAVSTVKARLSGWSTTRIVGPMARQLRQTSSAEGLWKGYVVRGMATYHVDCHPILVLGRALSYIVQPRPYLVIPFVLGYAISVIRKEPKVDDPAVRHYFRDMRWKELISSI